MSPAKKKKKRTRKKPAARAQRFSGKKYILTPDFEFLYELQDLILKSSPAQRDRMVRNINRLGRIKLAVISGIFLNKEQTEVGADLLIVGDDIDRRKLKNFLINLEAEIGKEISFAMMDKEEFNYRLAMFDRFTRTMIEGPHDKLINKLGL